MIFALFSITAIYTFSISLLVYGFFKVKQYHKRELSPKTSFTIIVPFRNEAENLPNLLNSFSNLNYPKDLFEVVLVDDSSEEKFQVSSFRFQVSVIDNIRISNSPKKDAITTAMQHVRSNWVITTDADCMVPENWLLTYDNYIQDNKVSMLAGL